MADLSAIKTRQTAQGRLTTNRDNVLPSRRDTDAPARQVNAEMRSAQRGSGAEELARIFGAVSAATSNLSDYIEDKKDRNAVAAVTQAQAAGQPVDPELLKRAAARKAYALGEGQRATYEFNEGITQEVDELLNDPNQQVDEADIDELIQKRVAEFGFVDGKPKDWGSSEANLAVAKSIGETSIKLRAAANKVIKQQVQDRGVQTSAFNMAASLREGKPLDFESAFKTLIPGTDLNAAKKELINSVDQFAESVIDTQPDRAVSVYDELLASKRGDGTPSLSAGEQEQVRQRRRHMVSEAEQAKAKAEGELWEKNSGGFLDRFNGVPGSGGYPTVSEILAARKENRISAEFAGSMISSIRADRELNGSGTVSRSTGGSSKGNDDDPPNSADLITDVYSGRRTSGQAWQSALQRAQQGLFGTGKDRYKALADIRKNLNLVASLEKGAMEPYDARIDAWKTGAKKRAAAIRVASRRKAMEAEVDAVAARVKSRTLKRLQQGGNGSLQEYMDAGLGAASDTLISKYNLD